ncbi:uncharacterized protein LOC135223102 [Macrobrachium nipponense]|uniref:uncharacterized protein LOC135223102 n=1 Tax=Macrobrachium nipponense TaxID=159736 RepID=UPI0030C81655
MLLLEIATVAANPTQTKKRQKRRKKVTYWRKPIEPDLYVAITLYFLTTGQQFSFWVAQNTISYIAPETCRAIVAAYGDEERQVLQTPAAWQGLPVGLRNGRTFPMVIRAIDGKHIRLHNPPIGGTLYFNYKKFYSMVLLAIADASYKFPYVDVGAIGSESGSGVFATTQLGEMLLKQEANLPQSEALPGQPNGSPVDYFLVGDDAFPLQDYFMKPHPKRGLSKEEWIYNYRLSRARRMVENVFRILANRFQVFHTAISLKLDHVKTLLLAARDLHNIIIRKNACRQEGDQEHPVTNTVIPGSWKSDASL